VTGWEIEKKNKTKKPENCGLVL